MRITLEEQPLEEKKYVRKTKRVGDILVDSGAITDAQLKEVLDECRKTGMRIGEQAIRMGLVTQQIIDDAICKQQGIEFVNIKAIEVDPDAIACVDKKVLQKYLVVPFAFDERNPNILKVATSDPTNIIAMDDISIASNKSIRTYLAHEEDIISYLGQRFGNDEAQDSAQKFLEGQKDFEDRNAEEDIARKNDIENSPIVTIVRQIIEGAVRQGASDIHIEPFEEVAVIRYRIDGVLKKEKATYSMDLYPALIARLKIMSGMDISEKRKPQDGRITIMVDNKEYDIRVSNLPTVFGEKVVMRLAKKEGFKRDKKDLGMQPEDLKRFEGILHNPHGIILVTGPTGSGKSTTLYTALNELATDEVNIITVEDPVEANVEKVNQVQVNNKADLTFASALRSILRQDPDIIMIGEIRDGETAGIAVKASITGHLVVSTLHTNSTAASISRLIDMGVEPYLLGDSLVGIIAQRLVRRLCPDCRDIHEATEYEKRILGVDKNEPLRIYQCHTYINAEGKEARGCKMCNHSGYRGRIGVYEIMAISRKLRNLIAARANADEINAVAVEEGMHTLRQAASKYVLDGTTSFDEMMKITYETEDDA